VGKTKKVTTRGEGPVGGYHGNCGKEKYNPDKRRGRKLKLLWWILILRERGGGKLGKGVMEIRVQGIGELNEKW